MRPMDRMLAMVRDMAPTEEIRLSTAERVATVTGVRLAEYRTPANLRSHVPINSTGCPCGATAFLVAVRGGWGVECPSCGRSLLYPRRTEMGALESFDMGRLLAPPSRTRSAAYEQPAVTRDLRPGGREGRIPVRVLRRESGGRAGVPSPPSDALPSLAGIA